jgi:hypothetical protein
MEDWVQVQVKTFTKWVNLHLRSAGITVSDVTKDFQDGYALAKLVSELTGEKIKVPKPTQTPLMKLRCLENINATMKCLKDKVKLVNIGALDIYDGSIKQVLGLLWTLILKFEVEDIVIDGISGKKGLLLWCQRVTRGYDNVNIQNFDKSWRTGLAFDAIIHHFRPDLIEYAELKEEEAQKNAAIAFDVAEKNFGIPQVCCRLFVCLCLSFVFVCGGSQGSAAGVRTESLLRRVWTAVLSPAVYVTHNYIHPLTGCRDLRTKTSHPLRLASPRQNSWWSPRTSTCPSPTRRSS